MALPKMSRRFARDELDEFHFYETLARTEQDADNRRVLEELAQQEREHVDFWCEVGGLARGAIKPSRARLAMLRIARRLLGLSFTIRWLERGESHIVESYREVLDSGVLDESHAQTLRRIIDEEVAHEQQLERRIADERREYLGAAVLGLNDALVELTGGLAGLASSISDTKLIAFSGLVVGTAAAFSMAASNFLSIDIGEDATDLEPKRAAAYTGFAYIGTVLALVAPFFFFADRGTALAVTWTVAVAIIAMFSYYSSVLQAQSFRKRFAQMLALGLGVAVVTFAIGRALGAALGIEV